LINLLSLGSNITEIILQQFLRFYANTSRDFGSSMQYAIREQESANRRNLQVKPTMQNNNFHEETGHDHDRAMNLDRVDSEQQPQALERENSPARDGQFGTSSSAEDSGERADGSPPEYKVQESTTPGENNTRSVDSSEREESGSREAKSEDASVAEQRPVEKLAGTEGAMEPLAGAADSAPTWQSLLKRLNAKAVGTPEQYLQFGPFTYDDGALTQIVGGRSRRITLALYNKDLDLRARIIEAARQSGCINPDSLPEELEPVQKRLDEFWEEINGMRDLCEGYGYVITASHVGLTVALKKEKKGADTTAEVTN
jgi:hypothetical protein